MDERDVVKRLGPPTEIISRREGMKAHKWRCADCGEAVAADAPIPVPAPCKRCGGVFFRTVRDG